MRTVKFSKFLSINTIFAASGYSPPTWGAYKLVMWLEFPSFFKIDVIEIEALSFIRQEIMRRVIRESQLQGRSPLSGSVIDAVVQQFSVLAPTINQCFCTVVVRCALNIHLSQQQVSTWWFSTFHVTPHMPWWDASANLDSANLSQGGVRYETVVRLISFTCFVTHVTYVLLARQKHSQDQWRESRSLLETLIGTKVLRLFSRDQPEKKTNDMWEFDGAALATYTLVILTSYLVYFWCSTRKPHGWVDFITHNSIACFTGFPFCTLVVYEARGSPLAQTCAFLVAQQHLQTGVCI